jgi:hypothetical protein
LSAHAPSSFLCRGFAALAPRGLAALAPHGFAALALALCATAAADDEPFELTRVASEGRTVAAEIVDVSGDGRSDLIQVVYDGIPPEETRVVRVFRQREDGSLPRTPDSELALPEGVAIYDLADLDERPGSELLLLRPRDLALLSLADGSLRTLGLDSATSAGVGADERGLDRLDLLQQTSQGERWLIVPLLGESLVLTPKGELRGRPRVGSRSNYFLAEATGAPIRETGIQGFFDAALVTPGDVDGDGRSDLIASTRHALRIFRQRPDGRFPSEPDRLLPLRRLSEEDHIRAAGTVSVLAEDLDRDGRVDLIVTHTGGGVTSARSETTIHLNRDGSWDLATADQRFESEGGWTGGSLTDMDGDGQPELVRVRIDLGVLEMVEFFLQRALDAHIAVHSLEAGGRFAQEPRLELDVDVAWSLETFRPRGFLVDLGPDLNGDGYRDMVASNAGESIDVSLGGPGRELGKRVARQPADSRGRVRFGDIDGDGLPDLLIYDPTRPDAPVWLARNAGRLPGTQPGLRAVPAARR